MPMEALSSFSASWIIASKARGILCARVLRVETAGVNTYQSSGREANLITMSSGTWEGAILARVKKQTEAEDLTEESLSRDILSNASFGTREQSYSRISSMMQPASHLTS